METRCVYFLHVQSNKNQIITAISWQYTEFHGEPPKESKTWKHNYLIEGAKSVSQKTRGKREKLVTVIKKLLSSIKRYRAFLVVGHGIFQMLEKIGTALKHCNESMYKEEYAKFMNCVDGKACCLKKVIPVTGNFQLDGLVRHVFPTVSTKNYRSSRVAVELVRRLFCYALSRKWVTLLNLSVTLKKETSSTRIRISNPAPSTTTRILKRKRIQLIETKSKKLKKETSSTRIRISNPAPSTTTRIRISNPAPSTTTRILKRKRIQLIETKSKKRSKPRKRKSYYGFSIDAEANGRNEVTQLSWVIFEFVFCEGVMEEAIPIDEQDYLISDVAEKMYYRIAGAPSLKKCKKYGIPLVCVIDKFLKDLLFYKNKGQTKLIGHDLASDARILDTSFQKKGLISSKYASLLKELKNHGLCTQKMALPFIDCGTLNGGNPKPIRLTDLLLTLVPSSSLEGSHNALVDSRFTMKCYCEMLQRKWYNDKDEITIMVEHYSPIKSHDLLLYGGLPDRNLCFCWRWCEKEKRWILLTW